MEQIPSQKPLEQKEQLPPRNLKTHPEETIEAIALIEGPDWLDRQSRIEKEDELNPGAYEEGSIAHALDLLQRGRSSKILGKHAWNRWHVKADGTVTFSSRFAEMPVLERQDRDKELLQKVRELGFEIVE